MDEILRFKTAATWFILKRQKKVNTNHDAAKTQRRILSIPRSL